MSDEYSFADAPLFRRFYKLSSAETFSLLYLLYTEASPGPQAISNVLPWLLNGMDGRPSIGDPEKNISKLPCITKHTQGHVIKGCYKGKDRRGLLP